MRSTSFLVVLATAFFLARTPPALAAPPPASLADARAEFDAGQFRPCLQKISGALASPEAKSDPQTRYDLLMLRGEAMLRLGERRMAADAFRSAANVLKQKDDRKRLADATATALLVDAAHRTDHGTTYTPAGDASEPIDIIEPDSRKRAQAALFADALVANRPKIDQALRAATLVRIQELLPILRNLYTMELAATGDAAQTMPLARALGQHARDLIAGEFSRISERLDSIALAAADAMFVVSPGAPSEVLALRGLNSRERDELHGLADALAKAEHVAQQGRWISRQTDGPTEAWEALLADCSELKSRAQQLWDRRY